MPISAHDTVVEITGTPTGMVDEACTEITPTEVWRITNAAKRVLDPDAALSVEVDAVAADPGDYTVDYLFGTVTFDPPLSGGEAVTVTANYLPRLVVLEAREFNVAMSAVLADSTVFKSSPHRTREAVLKDASGSVGDLRALYDDLDAGGGTVKLFDLLANGTRKVLSIAFGSSGYAWRGWILFESEEVKGPRDELINSTLGWQLATALGNARVAFGIGAV